MNLFGFEIRRRQQPELTTLPPNIGTRPAWAPSWEDDDNIIVSEQYLAHEAEQLPAVSAALTLLSRELASLEFFVEDLGATGWESVEETDFEAGLVGRRWGRAMTKSKGVTLAMRSMMLRGFAAVYVIRHPDGTPSELVPLNPAFVQRNALSTGIEYKWLGGGGDIPELMARSNLVWLDWTPPADGVTSVPPLRQCWQAIRAALQATIWSANYFKRFATPRTLYERQEGYSADSEDLWDDEDAMREQGRSSMVLAPGLTPKTVGGGVRDADLVNVMTFGVQEVCRVFGLPPMTLQELSKGSFANYSQSLRYLARFTIAALARQWSDELSLVLYPSGYRRVRVDVGDVGDETRLDAARRLQTLVFGGIMSQDDARIALGMQPAETEESQALRRGNTFEASDDVPPETNGETQ